MWYPLPAVSRYVRTTQGAQLRDAAAYLLGDWEPPAVLEYLRTRIELTTDRRGVTSLEYALIGSIIVAAIVAGFTPLANTLSTLFAPIVAAL